MRTRLTRRELLLIGSVALFALALVFSFGPVVRSLARARAAKRHIDVEIRTVRPGWYAVRLLGVVARPEGVSGIRVAADEARIDLSFWLTPKRLTLRGAALEANGSIEVLHDQIAKWRELGARPPNSTSETDSKRKLAVIVDGMSARWTDVDGVQPIAEAEGVSAVSDDRGIQAQAHLARARLGPTEFSTADAELRLTPAGMVTRARAGSLVVTVRQRAPNVPEPVQSPVGVPTEPAKTADPSAPLLALPNLHASRTRITLLTSLLVDRIGNGADVGVDAVTWKIPRANEQVSFTLGPGPLTLSRSSEGFDGSFSTDPHAARTPLTVRIKLPAQGDPAVFLEGGPISLSLLGVQEGAAGLVDVVDATVSGRARVVLADDGSALTFDGEAGSRGLAISNPRLALDVLDGLDVAVRARGALTADGQLRIDELAASFGAVHITAGGVLDQTSDHVSAAFHFEVPRASCQSLLDSFPSALLPALQGTKIAGNFSARGRFGFDTRSLDDLQLDYDIKDQCRLIQVPRELSRERFEHEFSHRIYLPDGSIADETTGPGTDNWTPLDEISPYMQVAVLTTEDGAFPKHHGFSRASIRSSLVANLKARRFARGASTITMQLAKNLFLSRDKTLSRKLEEVVLTDYLEQTFSKDELMELYLNVIEFGPSIYGITAAADYYFGRTPAELNLSECMFLSSLLPAPLRYSAMREAGQVPEGWMRVLRTFMKVAHKYGRITDDELADAEKQPVTFWRGGERPPPRPPVRVRQGLAGEAGDVNTTPGVDVPAGP